METTETKEYLMLRNEILQYIQNYHNVKSVMYSVCGVIFTFLFARDKIITEPLVYLCPILVVIPAYLTAVNLWLSVSTDSAYLMVFHEEKGNTFHWESRYSSLCKTEMYTNLYGGKFFEIFNMNAQLLPYLIMSAISMLLYFYRVFAKDSSSHMFSCNTYFIISIVIIVIMTFVFVKYSPDKKDRIIEAWRAVRDKEVQCNHE